MRKNQFTQFLKVLILIITLSLGYACSSSPAPDVDEPEVTLHEAFSEFDKNEIDISVSGDNVVVKTTGYPNHKTPYWGIGHELYIEPTVTSEDQMTPARIPQLYLPSTLTVSQKPVKAASTTAIPFGAIGIAVSGAVIYGDKELYDPFSGQLVNSSLDYAGGHIDDSKPYHYHLEPLPITNDDDNLVGIMADGFFIYGRKCHSTGPHTHPGDLDASGGHTSITQHSNQPEYHYHIVNKELVGTGRHLIFPGPYRGTPRTINN